MNVKNSAAAGGKDVVLSCYANQEDAEIQLSFCYPEAASHYSSEKANRNTSTGHYTVKETERAKAKRAVDTLFHNALTL